MSISHPFWVWTTQQRKHSHGSIEALPLPEIGGWNLLFSFLYLSYTDFWLLKSEKIGSDSYLFYPFCQIQSLIILWFSHILVNVLITHELRWTGTLHLEADQKIELLVKFWSISKKNCPNPSTNNEIRTFQKILCRLHIKFKCWSKIWTLGKIWICFKKSSSKSVH